MISPVDIETFECHAGQARRALLEVVHLPAAGMVLVRAEVCSRRRAMRSAAPSSYADKFRKFLGVRVAVCRYGRARTGTDCNCRSSACGILLPKCCNVSPTPDK